MMCVPACVRVVSVEAKRFHQAKPLTNTHTRVSVPETCERERGDIEAKGRNSDSLFVAFRV